MSMDEIDIKEVFDEKAMEDVESLLKKRDDKGLRDFIEMRGYEIRRAGLLPDKLYYWLKNQYAYKFDKVF
jgi:hypothetical protein